MADTHETIADVRKDAEAKFRELVEAYMQRRSAFQTTVGAMQAFNNVFDRLEAAHKREVREAVTCSNQLRDALVKARRFIDSSPLVSIMDNTGTIARGELCAEIDAALAAPPRNCDRFATLDEARAAHEAICEKYVKCHNGCPLNNEEHYSAFDCFEAWLFAPSTEQEGGNDADK